MIKEKVIDVIFEPVFDVWAMRIMYQNEDILKRGKFRDKELNVYSNNYPKYIKDSNTLFIKGDFISNDDNIVFLSNEDKLKVEEKIKKLNEKYFTYRFSRESKGMNYYYITSEFEVNETEEIHHEVDDCRNNIGNYFYTKKEALECSEYLKKCLIDWRKERCED